MGLTDLNKRAEETFNKLKESKGWTRRNLSAVTSCKEVDVQKLEKMLDSLPAAQTVTNEEGKYGQVVNVMEFIDSLQLPPNISIAMACLITYGEKKEDKVLFDAIEYIRGEIENG